MNLFGLLLTSLACCFWLVCCPVRLPTQSAHPDSTIRTAKQLLESVQAKGSQLNSLQLSGILIVQQEGKSIKTRFSCLVKRPSHLRFETHSFFEQPISILVTNGMDFSLWDMDNERFIKGLATPANISRVIPISLDGPEVVGVLLGDPPLIPFARSSIRWSRKKQQYWITLENSTAVQDIWVHPRTLRPTKIRCKNNESMLYQITFLSWKECATLPTIAMHTIIEMPSKNTRLQLNAKQIKKNPSLDSSLFLLHPPDNIPLEIVGNTPSSGSTKPSLRE